MNRYSLVILLAALLLTVAACSSGGGGTTTPPGSTNIVIDLFGASPNLGTGTAADPLAVSFTVSFTGGEAPYNIALDFDAKDVNGNGTIEETELAFDSYRNGVFDRNLNVATQYSVRREEGDGPSEFKAVVRIVDKTGRTLISSPVSVVVTGSSVIVFDPAGTFAFSNELDDTGTYVFRTGQPVFFRAAVTGGKQPFSYEWDFTGDGSVDSTEQAPQFTFTNNVSNIRTFNTKLRIFDVSGNQSSYDFLVPVYGAGVENFTTVVVSIASGSVFTVTDASRLKAGQPITLSLAGGGSIETVIAAISGNEITLPTELLSLSAGDKLRAIILPNPPPQFEILLNSTPAEQDGIVTLRYDPTGTDTSLPLQPELHLAVVVNPDPAKGGVPPYEYYWDFEADGSFDSQAVSPTIPFYDAGAKQLVNPYLSLESEKSFKLTVTVIDSAGQKRVRELNIKVFRGGGSVTPLAITSSYTLDASPLPYASVSGDFDAVVGVFNLGMSSLGANKVYEVQFDIDNDGTPDAVDLDNDALTPKVAGFGQITGNSLSVPVTFGVYDNDGDALTVDAADWPVPNYYPVNVTVRRLSGAGGSEEDRASVLLPVSLVQTIDQSTLVRNNTLIARTEHSMAPFFRVEVGGANGQTLAERGVDIIGGSIGGLAIRDVQRVTELFNPPTLAGLKESPASQPDGSLAAISTRVGMAVERSGHCSFIAPANPSNWLAGGAIFAFGGRNSANGILGSTELKPAGDNNGTLGWTIGAEIRAPTLYQLTESMCPSVAAFNIDIGNGPVAANMICGGLNKGSSEGITTVSGKTLLYVAQAVPTDPQEGNPPGPDLVGDLGADMITPRYDGCFVFDGVDKVFAIGGRVSGGQSVSTVEFLDLSQPVPRWFRAPSMLNARSGCTAQAVNGKIYVYGGAFYTSTNSPKQLVPAAEVFDPLTGRWSLTLPPAFTTDSVTSAVMPGPGSVNAPVGPAGIAFNSLWLFGGSNASNAETNSLQEFVYFYTF